MAERVAYQIERFGKSRFKGIGYKTLQVIMDSGAVGAEVVISGRIPGKRHNTWRFKSGSLPKNGHVANQLVDKGFKEIHWKQGSVGIKVLILRPDIKTPDYFKLVKEVEHDSKEEGNKRNE
jgi:small subunit ribosomal protein S3